MPSAFKFATLNVHYLWVGNDTTRWEERAPAVVAALSEIDADVVAFQEMETFGVSDGSPRHFSYENRQLEYVLSQLTEYRVTAIGDPAEYPSTQPIIYRPEVVEPLNQGFFFFSPSPDQIYSQPWHARFPAFASWVRFRHIATDRTFLVYNVHFDVQSARNRTKSSRLVIERASGEAGTDEPVLVVGDFNAPRFFPAMGRFRRAGYRRARANGATFHFFRGLRIVPAIDHILGSGEVVLSNPEVHRERFDGSYPSDHYPVSATVGF